MHFVATISNVRNDRVDPNCRRTIPLTHIYDLCKSEFLVLAEAQDNCSLRNILRTTIFSFLAGSTFNDQNQNLIKDGFNQFRHINSIENM